MKRLKETIIKIIIKKDKYSDECTIKVNEVI